MSDLHNSNETNYYDIISSKTTDAEGMQEIERKIKQQRDAKFARRMLLENTIAAASSNVDYFNHSEVKISSEK